MKRTIPDGLYACHRCDTPACVNPAHIFIGNDKDNIGDMRSKDRHARGERRASQAKLTDDAVRDIRAWEGQDKELVTRYGVSQSLISMVKNGKRWAHLNAYVQRKARE